jgi:hypothetical protein
MKKQLIIGTFVSLFSIGLISCSKEDDNNPTTTTTTTGASTGTTSGTGNNSSPLATKLCRGNATITINGKDTVMTAEEKLGGVFTHFSISNINSRSSLFLLTGDSTLPSTSRIFTVTDFNSIDSLPKPSDISLSYWDAKEDVDYLASAGTVSYTINATEKIVRFNNIVFESVAGEKITMSYEARLK